MKFLTTSSLVLPLSLYLLSTTSIYLRSLERRERELYDRNRDGLDSSNNSKLDLSDPSSDATQKLTGSSDTGILNGLTSLLKLSPNSQNNADTKSNMSSDNRQNSDSSSGTSSDSTSTQSSGGLLNLVGISNGSNDNNKFNNDNNGIAGSNNGLLGLFGGGRSSQGAAIRNIKKSKDTSVSNENNSSSSSEDNLILIFPKERQEGNNSNGSSSNNGDTSNRNSNGRNGSVAGNFENDENSSSDRNDSSTTSGGRWNANANEDLATDVDSFSESISGKINNGVLNDIGDGLLVNVAGFANRS